MADESTQAGAQPPKPGDSVPTGGLDPTQVFASPPGGAAPAGGQAGDGTAPPKDTSPPPPPPGTQATKEMGYDDEDIKSLQEVGNYRFGSITVSLTNDNIVVPPHPETTFDEQSFLTLLCGSISLFKDEKWRIIQAIPKLSQQQIDELQNILREEKKKFAELSPKHLRQLKQLEQKHAEDWKDLQSMYVQDQAKQKESAQADEIRKKLGLN